MNKIIELASALQNLANSHEVRNWTELVVSHPWGMRLRKIFSCESSIFGRDGASGL